MIAVRFLAAALNPKFPVPDNLIPEIGHLLRKFADDPDGRLASKDTPMMGNWLTTAINSVKGSALEQLLQLALNQKRSTTPGIPEAWIFELIQSSLTALDRSPATFAILGSRLSLVLHLYGDEFEGSPHLLLPPASPEHQKAFIISHILYGNPVGAVPKILPSLPNASIDCLATLIEREKSENEDSKDFGGRVGTHVAFYYWNDCYRDAATAEATVDRYFEIAERRHRSWVVGNIAQIFSDAKPAPESESLYKRVRELWDRRFRVIERQLADGTYKVDDVEKELCAFTKWLGCECHPFDWRHDRILRSVSRMEGAPRAIYILKSLESLSRDPDKLGPCLEILEALLLKETEIVSWEYNISDMKPLLVRGVSASDPNTQERTRRIQETLVRHGLFDYHDLEGTGCDEGTSE